MGKLIRKKTSFMVYKVECLSLRIKILTGKSFQRPASQQDKIHYLMLIIMESFPPDRIAQSIYRS